MIKRVFFSVLLTLASCPNVFGEDAPKEKPHATSQWTITAECKMIVVPQKDAISLINEFNDDAKAEAAWERVNKMVEEGKADLVGNLIVKGAEGKRLITECIEEMKYGTEFEPPQLPTKLPEGKELEALKAWPLIGITATAFETRNVGTTMDLESTVSEDGSDIGFVAAPQHVRFQKWYKIDNGRLANGEHLFIEQPYFHTMKNTMSLRVKNGQKILAGSFRLPDSSTKSFELFLLTVKAVKNGTK